MSFLKQLLTYKRICIQCHNNPDPDTVASAFGVQKFLNQNGISFRRDLNTVLSSAEFALNDVTPIVEQTIIGYRLTSFTIKSRREVDFRTVGFYTPTNTWSKERKAEYKMREWMPLNEKGENA